MRIQTTVEFSGVPKGTTGTAERDEGTNDWCITWDLPHRLFGSQRKPLRDWFDQEEFDKYLVIID